MAGLKTSLIKWSVLLASCCLSVSLVLAAPEDPVTLRFSPADTTVAAGLPGRLSIMLDQELTVRTLDINVAYDTTIVKSTGWEPGTLFTDTGHFLFKGFEEEVLGHWHAYVIIIGSGLYATGPGELLAWDYVGAADGVTSVSITPFAPDTLGLFLSDANGDWYHSVDLDGTTVTIGDSTNSVELPPALQPLQIWPNPFNPTATLQMEIGYDCPLNLSVYDLSGRHIRTLQDGYQTAGSATWNWNGNDNQGKAMPSGVYIFRAETDHSVNSVRGILLK